MSDKLQHVYVVNPSSGGGGGGGVVSGNLTNNNAPPAADNIGALVAVANAAAPTLNEGDQVLLSVDLAGNLRTNASGGGGSGGNLQANPISLFTATGAGTSLSAKLWPGTYTVALPVKGSGLAANISNGGTVIGGVFAPATTWSAVLIDLACVGNASTNLVIEVGRLAINGAMAQVLSSVTLTTGSALSIGPIAVNPFTAAVIAPTTFKLFDLVILNSKAVLGQLLVEIGGAADNTPSQLVLATTEVSYYYVICTSLDAAMTSVICAITPQ